MMIEIDTVQIVSMIFLGIALVFSHISMFFLGKARAYNHVAKMMNELDEKLKKKMEEIENERVLSESKETEKECKDRPTGKGW